MQFQNYKENREKNFIGFPAFFFLDGGDWKKKPTKQTTTSRQLYRSDFVCTKQKEV